MQCKQQAQSGINTEVLNGKQQGLSYLRIRSLRYPLHSRPRGGTFIRGAHYITSHMFTLAGWREEVISLFIRNPESREIEKETEINMYLCFCVRAISWEPYNLLNNV